jgi:hypothetical protein
MAPKKGKEGSLNTSGEEEGEGGQAGSWAEGLAKGEFCFCYCFKDHTDQKIIRTGSQSGCALVTLFYQNFN